ncbi:cadherin-like protein 26 isoform X3 [Macaca fascicularis]|uniref:cadherin-like protein 26 isoform X3 n=1 Tax=Macaca fascicularis TaxID=9541 RepID=UPI0032B04259
MLSSLWIMRLAQHEASSLPWRMRRGSSTAREESFSHQGRQQQAPLYKRVHDPANWVSVDENSGVVTTVEPIDRESPHVNDSFYIIIVHAVDDGFPPQTATGTLMLFLSDINDNAPTLRPHSRYMEVCESAVHQPLHIEAEDPDLEPFSDPFTFELDNTLRNAEDTWKLGKNWGHSVELLTLRSLPRGNYLVPLFIGDKQGLSQKQTVHVRICPCASGFTCVEHADAGVGLLVGALSPVCAAFVALAVALLFLLRRYFVLEPKRHGCSISNDEGHQTLVMYNEESKATSAQTWSDVEGHRPALLVCIAAAGPKQGAKDLKEVPPSAASRAAQARSALGSWGYGELFESRGVENMYSTPAYPDATVHRQLLALVEGRMAETLNQKLRVADVLEDDPSYLPHVYSQEGECGGASSLSSLASLEQELPPDLLDSLGSKATLLEEICSESGGPS